MKWQREIQRNKEIEADKDGTEEAITIRNEKGRYKET